MKTCIGHSKIKFMKKPLKSYHIATGPPAKIPTKRAVLQELEWSQSQVRVIWVVIYPPHAPNEIQSAKTGRKALDDVPGAMQLLEEQSLLEPDRSQWYSPGDTLILAESEYVY